LWSELGCVDLTPKEDRLGVGSFEMLSSSKRYFFSLLTLFFLVTLVVIAATRFSLVEAGFLSLPSSVPDVSLTLSSLSNPVGFLLCFLRIQIPDFFFRLIVGGDRPRIFAMILLGRSMSIDFSGEACAVRFLRLSTDLLFLSLLPCRDFMGGSLVPSKSRLSSKSLSKVL
jgi:hypothetical protein